MCRLIPLLKERLSPVVNMLIPALVDNNLNSKHPGIYAAASNVVQALCQHLGKGLLPAAAFVFVCARWGWDWAGQGFSFPSLILRP